jgi:hypothetical protein
MGVARHGMPGMCHPEPRPVGYGMIGWREGLWSRLVDKACRHRSYPPRRRRITSAIYQAFHAWLPSFRPSGTKARSASTQNRFRHLRLLRFLSINGDEFSDATRLSWRISY